jgi:hypothetical protein
MERKILASVFVLYFLSIHQVMLRAGIGRFIFRIPTESH